MQQWHIEFKLFSVTRGSFSSVLTICYFRAIESHYKKRLSLSLFLGSKSLQEGKVTFPRNSNLVCIMIHLIIFNMTPTKFFFVTIDVKTKANAIWRNTIWLFETLEVPPQESGFFFLSFFFRKSYDELSNCVGNRFTLITGSFCLFLLSHWGIFELCHYLQMSGMRFFTGHVTSIHQWVQVTQVDEDVNEPCAAFRPTSVSLLVRS